MCCEERLGKRSSGRGVGNFKRRNKSESVWLFMFKLKSKSDILPKLTSVKKMRVHGVSRVKIDLSL